MNKFELSFQQEEMWIAEKFYSSGTMFTIGGYMLLDSDLDENILLRASHSAIQKCQNLKLKVMIGEDGAPYQCYQEEANYDIELLDLNCNVALDWMNNKMKEPVFADSPKLIFIAIIKTKEKKYYFLKIHHILIDFWGILFYFNILFHYYDEFKKGTSTKEIDVGDYRDYLLLQKKYKNSELWEKDKYFWEDELRGLKAKSNNSQILFEDSVKSLVEYILVDEDVKKKIEEKAAENQVTTFVVWTYIVGETLRRIENADFFVLGVHFLNRLTREQRQTPGLFVNTLPIKIEKNDLDSSLKNVSLKIKRIFKHQSFSIRKLEDSKNLFSAILSYESFNKKDEFLRNHYIFPLKSNESSYPLTFYVIDQGTHFKIDIVYHKSLGKELISSVVENLWKTINEIIV